MIKITKKLNYDKKYNDYMPTLIVEDADNEHDFEELYIGCFDNKDDAKRATNKLYNYVMQLGSLECLRDEMRSEEGA